MITFKLNIIIYYCLLKNLKSNNRFNHEELGWNYRFTNMQAALGLNQLKRIDQIIKKKREIGNYFYNNLKKNNNIRMVTKNANATNIPSSDFISWVITVLMCVRPE